MGVGSDHHKLHTGKACRIDYLAIQDVFRVGKQNLDQELAVEAIDPHGHVAPVGFLRAVPGTCRFLFPADDAPVGGQLTHAEARSFRAVEFKRANGNVRARVHMLPEH